MEQVTNRIRNLPSRAPAATAEDIQGDSTDRASTLLDHAIDQLDLLSAYLENLDERDRMQMPGLRALTLPGVVHGIREQVAGARRALSDGAV